MGTVGRCQECDEVKSELHVCPKCEKKLCDFCMEEHECEK